MQPDRNSSPRTDGTTSAARRSWALKIALVAALCEFAGLMLALRNPHLWSVWGVLALVGVAVLLVHTLRTAWRLRALRSSGSRS